MSFEAPEITKTNTTDNPASFSLMGNSLKEGLDSIQSINDVQNTSQNHLPNVGFTGLDSQTNQTDMGDNNNPDLNQDPPPKAKDTTNYPPDEPKDGDCNTDKGSDQIDGYTGSDSDDKDASTEQGTNELDERANAEPEGNIFIDLDADLEVDKDGKVKKITYTDRNGKKHSLTSDKWKNVKGSKDLPDGWSATRGDNGEITIQMPNGKLIHLDAKGRFKGYVNPNK